MSEEKPTKLIPNTFQCFNAHVDVAMELLTGDEYKVLNFATRHILGWQDSIQEEKKRISLTMFEKGFISKKNGRRFAGTGIGRKTLTKIVAWLSECGLLIAVGEATNDGQLWELGDSPDWQKLLDRANEKLSANQKRTVNARQQSLTIRNGGVSHTPPTGVSDTPEGEAVAHTTGGDVGHTTGGVLDTPNQIPYSNPTSKPYTSDEPDVTPPENSDVHIVTENADISEQVATPPTPNVPPEPPPPSHEQVVAAIMAWWDNLPAQPKNITSTKQVFGNPTNRAYAVNMLKAGITPDDIRAFVKDKTGAGGFYADKPLKFGKVAEDIPSWLNARKPKAPTNPIHQPINLDEVISKDDYIDPRFKALNDELAEKLSFKEAKKPA